LSRGVAILGSTGSIGRSTLAVLDRHPDRFHVVALAANRNAAELQAQCDRYRPDLCVLVDETIANGHAAASGWRTGRNALIEAATHPDVDIVLNAVVGAAGLEASLAALTAGKRLALANKESLVAAGPVVLEAARAGGGELVPVDSEHSAILQCLKENTTRDVERLVLTASGGPFRAIRAEDLQNVTPAQALRHPTWDMGAKITIDSATLVNKALEVIEAHFLFGVDYDHIDVVVHPQSIIHSMVEFIDGSVLAQLGFPTMEMPILYALTYPERIADDGPRRFDPVAAGQLTFETVDTQRFPAFGLGIEAGRAGGTMPAVFNAANEVAVTRFLAGELPFPEIASVIEETMQSHDVRAADSLETILAVDHEARVHAREVLIRRC